MNTPPLIIKGLVDLGRVVQKKTRSSRWIGFDLTLLDWSTKAAKECLWFIGLVKSAIYE